MVFMVFLWIPLVFLRKKHVPTFQRPELEPGPGGISLTPRAAAHGETPGERWAIGRSLGKSCGL